MASDTRATKRTRTGLADPPPSPLHLHRDWASLTSGPAGLIAERVLSTDVADYVRFRGVCTAWRKCSADPRAQGVADRRIHPRRWIMLPRSCSPRRFLNVSTGERIHVRMPDLRQNYLLGSTAEGLLVLCRKRTLAVQLLNPLTGQLTDLPRATTMLVPVIPTSTSTTLSTARRLRSSMLHSAGLADDSTVALRYNCSALAVAKPGDERWTQLRVEYTASSNIMPSVLPFAGHLYCVTHKSISVVETTANQQPRLVPVADYKLEGEEEEPSQSDWMYPVYDDDGNLIFVHRNTAGDHYSDERYTTYQARLDTGSLVRMRGLGGQALFVSRREFLAGGRSVSVSAKVSSTIGTDTVYVCNSDFFYENLPEVVAFDLLGASSAAEPKFGKKDIAGCLRSYVRSSS